MYCLHERKLKKMLTQILLANRSIQFGDLINGKSNQSLKSLFISKDFANTVTTLDQIFYILDELEREHLISIKKIVNSTKEGVRFFEGISVSVKGEESEVTANRLHWVVKKFQDMYRWEITAESGLINYAHNSYQTQSKRDKKWQMWLAVGIAILSSSLTAIFSYLLLRV